MDGSAHGLVFDLDPVMFSLSLGDRQLDVRWYTALFIVMVLLGSWAWVWQWSLRRQDREAGERFMFVGLAAVFIGARLGHVLFYQPADFLDDPTMVFDLSGGGLASHGAAAALLFSLLWLSRRQKLPFLEVVDCFVHSAAIGATLVRLGNFFNSEIVGRATDLPWAVRFVRYDQGAVARHPTQLYEVALGIATFAALELADRRAGRERRPVGLLAGVFGVVYFGGRFLVEFTKEYQVLPTGLTMGQWLSLPPVVIGAWVIYRARRGAAGGGAR